MIKAAFSQIARKSFVSVSSGIFSPRIESCSRKPMKRHYAWLTITRFLIWIDPPNTINLSLLNVHSFEKRPDRIP